MAIEIEIRVESDRYKISQKKIKQITAEILKAFKIKKASLNLLFVNDAKIKTLNRQFLKHNQPTDVIAWGTYAPSLRAPKGRSNPKSVILSEAKNLRSFGLRPQDDMLRGDIVISLDTTARQAREYGNSFFYELCFYLCHGILHILGWDDSTARQRSRMWNKQKKILSRLV